MRYKILKLFRIFFCNFNIMTVLSVLVILISSEALYSQEQLSLVDCYKMALKYNNILEISELDNEIADQNYEKAQSKRFPIVSLKSKYSYYYKIPTVSLPMNSALDTYTLDFGSHDHFSSNIHAEMPVYSFGRITSAIKVAELKQKSAELQKKQEIVFITENLLKYFYAILFQKEKIKIYQSYLDQIDTIQNITNEHALRDTVFQLDVLRTQIISNNYRNEMNEAEAMIKSHKIKLSNIIGIDYKDTYIKGDFIFEPSRLNEAGLIEHAFSQRNELKLFKNNQLMLEQQISLEKASDKPEIKFFSNYSIANGFYPLEPDQLVSNWNFGLNLSLPLFEPFPAYERALQYRYRLIISKLQEKQMIQDIKDQIYLSLLEIEKREQNISMLAENIFLAKEAYHFALKQYENLHIDYDALEKTIQTLVTNEIKRSEKIYNHLQARLHLCRTIDDFSWFIPYNPNAN